MELKKRLLRLAQIGDVGRFREVLHEVESGEEQLSLLCNLCFYPKSGDTLLHVASRYGHVDILRCLREEVSNVNFEKANSDGKRAMHEAAQMGQLQCLRYLLSLGLEVNCLKKADWTPLMLGCTKDSLEVVQALVTSGADLHLKNKDGWTSFHIACRQGNARIISFLLTVDPSVWATVSKNGRSPLHTAALHGQMDVVHLLLERALYPADQRDCCGTTPLMDALRIGRDDIAGLLISRHRADVFAADHTGRQALHLATQAGSCRSVILLIERWHVDCNAEAEAGVTPLQLACKEGQHEVVDALLDRGANVNHRDKKGRTALDIATAGRHLMCVSTLLEHGAKYATDGLSSQAS